MDGSKKNPIDNTTPYLSMCVAVDFFYWLFHGFCTYTHTYDVIYYICELCAFIL